MRWLLNKAQQHEPRQQVVAGGNAKNWGWQCSSAGHQVSGASRHLGTAWAEKQLWKALLHELSQPSWWQATLQCPVILAVQWAEAFLCRRSSAWKDGPRILPAAWCHKQQSLFGTFGCLPPRESQG